MFTLKDKTSKELREQPKIIFLNKLVILDVVNDQ